MIPILGATALALDDAMYAPHYRSDVSARASIDGSMIVDRAPRWQQVLTARISELRALPSNWDGAGADTPLPDVVYRVRNVIETALAQTNNPAAPFLVPLNDGGVQIEWHRNGADLEITFTGDGEVFALFEDKETGEELEAAGHEALNLLLRRARRVAEEIADAGARHRAAAGPEYLVAA